MTLTKLEVHIPFYRIRHIEGMQLSVELAWEVAYPGVDPI